MMPSPRRCFGGFGTLVDAIFVLFSVDCVVHLHPCLDFETVLICTKLNFRRLVDIGESPTMRTEGSKTMSEQESKFPWNADVETDAGWRSMARSSELSRRGAEGWGRPTGISRFRVDVSLRGNRQRLLKPRSRHWGRAVETAGRGLPARSGSWKGVPRGDSDRGHRSGFELVHNAVLRHQSGFLPASERTFF